MDSRSCSASVLETCSRKTLHVLAEMQGLEQERHRRKERYKHARWSMRQRARARCVRWRSGPHRRNKDGRRRRRRSTDGSRGDGTTHSGRGADHQGVSRQRWGVARATSRTMGGARRSMTARRTPTGGPTTACEKACCLTEYIVCSHLFNHITENGSPCRPLKRASRCSHNESAIVVAGCHLAAKEASFYLFLNYRP